MCSTPCAAAAKGGRLCLRHPALFLCCMSSASIAAGHQEQRLHNHVMLPLTQLTGLLAALEHCASFAVSGLSSALHPHSCGIQCLHSSPGGCASGELCQPRLQCHWNRAFRSTQGHTDSSIVWRSPTGLAVSTYQAVLSRPSQAFTRRTCGVCFRRALPAALQQCR